MLVVTNNAEHTLFEELKKCWESKPTHRCLHLKFSQIKEDKNEWFGKLTKILSVSTDETSAEIFFCHDNDIFILSRTLTHKRVKDIEHMLALALKPIQLNNIASLYEIGVDWSKIKTICERKIENLKHAKHSTQNRSGTIEKVSINQTLETIDKDAISTIGLRRMKRANPVILIVEDDPFSQRLIGNALKNDYTLSITESGQGALLNYVSKAPDILFLDIDLPDINGHEVLERLFKFDKDAYVVMFSGNGDKQNIMQAIQLGAKGFVGKPFTQDKLLQYIQKSPFIQEKLERKASHGHHNN